HPASQQTPGCRIASQAKPTPDALKTGDPARIEPSDRDDDVGVGAAAEVAEERLDTSSAKLVSDQSEETPSATPRDNGDLNTLKILFFPSQERGEATPSSDVDMDVDESDSLEGETTKEVEELPDDMAIDGSEGVPRETDRETRSPEDGTDIDRSKEVAGKAKGEEIPSTEAGRGELAGDSKTANPGEDNQAGGSAEIGEAEPRDDKYILPSRQLNHSSNNNATSVANESASDIQFISNFIPQKRALRTQEEQRKRLKVEHPLQMNRGHPEGLYVEPAGVPWFVGFDLSTIDHETQSKVSRMGATLLRDPEHMKRLEVPTGKLNDEIVEFSAGSLQILHRDEHCAFFAPLTTEKLMSRMTRAKQSETWPSLGEMEVWVQTRVYTRVIVDCEEPRPESPAPYGA
ncbi:hypothetical protein V5O48_015611, partial [Marasmius crinis-equi]